MEQEKEQREKRKGREKYHKRKTDKEDKNFTSLWIKFSKRIRTLLPPAGALRSLKHELEKGAKILISIHCFFFPFSRKDMFMIRSPYKNRVKCDSESDKNI